MRPGKTSITGHTFCPSGKVDSDDFSHKKWALACANAQNQTHFLSYKPSFMELLNEYIVFYNERRKKQSLGWMSPMQYRISKGLAA